MATMHIINLNDIVFPSTVIEQPPAVRERYRNVTQLTDVAQHRTAMPKQQIIRGNTYNLYSEPKKSEICKKSKESSLMLMFRPRRFSVVPVERRLHESVQTAKYLEVQCDKVVKSEIGCQTDLKVDSPPTELIVKTFKTGLDAATQVYTGDLFDFDAEVTPTVEVVVGKTLEQSQLEVLEEEELTLVNKERQKLASLQKQHTVEIQKVEMKEKRNQQEKEHRVSQYKKTHQWQNDLERRIAASTLTRTYLQDLIPSVMTELRHAGFTEDSLQFDIETGFIPWLVDQVQTELNQFTQPKEYVAEMIRDILIKRAKMYRSLGQRKVALVEGTEDSYAIKHKAKHVIFTGKLYGNNG